MDNEIADSRVTLEALSKIPVGTMFLVKDCQVAILEFVHDFGVDYGLLNELACGDPCSYTLSYAKHKSGRYTLLTTTNLIDLVFYPTVALKLQHNNHI